MDRTFTLFGEIADIVRREVKHMRFYWGEVIDNNDPNTKGRVKVEIPALGWTTPDQAAWCQSRDKHSMIVPNVGEYVGVYFLLGKEDRPVYFGQAHELAGQTPPSYTGPDSVVVYEDPQEGFAIVHDKAAEEVTIRDKHDNVIVLSSSGVSIEDANGNDITMGTTSVTINGNLEVLQ